ncbi:uridylate kinase [Bradyrhizobium ivorense]|uniref:amino acid kinase family protein n=1 Tax=Bradyrhizobium ivorense TaxID=2511166 RepID=UPI0010B62FE9|nr:uridylate kinase [Bradyrhizobium ivorense]VIO71643.1 Aspartate kinase Ask_LysC [Bradyrhizobium ivorense]
MNSIVLKFGGSTFLKPDDYCRVALQIASRLTQGANKIVTVVSAMSGTTGNLKAVMLDINNRAPQSALDAALATGEMLSACLMEAAISRLDIRVTSLCGYSLGIRTNSEFGRASIEEVDSAPVLKALENNDIVVVTGGQAVDQSGRLTMLGRNSSDLTAVVTAAALNCSSCEIYSDVCGVYTADPYIIPGARLIPELTFRATAEMSRHGAKVLHHRAVEYAEQHGVSIICKSLQDERETIGTRVGHVGDAYSIVIARDAKLLRYGNVNDRDLARTSLDQTEVGAISLTTRDGVPCIFLTIDSDFAIARLERTGPPPTSIGSATLVTEIGPGVARHYLEHDFEKAVALARRIHATLFPEADTKFSSHVDKQRSAYSSLLVNSQHRSFWD